MASTSLLPFASMNSTNLLLAQAPSLVQHFPRWMREYRVLEPSLAQWTLLGALAVAAFVVGWLLQATLMWLGQLVARRTGAVWDDTLLQTLPGPLRLFLTLFLFSQFLHLLELSPETEATLRTLITCGLIIALTWFALRFLTFGSAVLERYCCETDRHGEAQRRALHTQISVIRTILRFVILVVAAALFLLQFEVARSLGVSLLASAGLAGIVIGLAAQKTVAPLFAGIQVAFTQPIKIGDVVVVEGEWGRIEEIKLTYVVVKIWDLRRLILPITHFTDKPFQNWTTASEQVLGTVFLHTDYTVSVDEIRAELKRILGETDLWDQQVQGAQVTNLTERSVEVRLLVSGANSSKLWDLRCLVREKMLAWLQARGKPVLPVYRVESSSGAGDGREAPVKMS